MLAVSLLEQASRVLALCRTRGLHIATAESCTGGLVAAALTAIAGSSDVFERGFVTYSNGAKEAMLGVPAALIARHGAVSEPVARAMAEGALQHSEAGLAVSVTGVAGPGGGSVEKPVGLVWVAAARRGSGTASERHLFPGDRGAVRAASVTAALALLARCAEEGG
ncbi:MAG: nicotinamide-nucleotide amidohydrolase family protein [Rhodospirillales bacterium]|nr:nicotinamide-nucleotide amidohydrolase family protein [Rhodospirillales bacterium]